MHAGRQAVATEPDILPPLDKNSDTQMPFNKTRRSFFLPLELCVGVGLVALSNIKRHHLSQKWPLTTNPLVAICAGTKFFSRASFCHGRGSARKHSKKQALYQFKAIEHAFPCNSVKQQLASISMAADSAQGSTDSKEPPLSFLFKDGHPKARTPRPRRFSKASKSTTLANP